MFKDYDKYLSTSLKVYVFVLMIVFIMKMVGLDYFGLSFDNRILLKISNIVEKNNLLKDIINLTMLSFQFYFYLCIVCERKKLYFHAFISSLLNIIIQLLLVKFLKANGFYYLFSFCIMVFAPIIINKKISFRKQLKYIVIISIYQLISLFIRNIGIYKNYESFLIDSLLNIDQLLLLAINYNIYFMKGDVKKCHLQEVGYSLQNKINLKHLPKKLQENLHKFKSKEKVEKLTIIIYFILSFIWNMFTLLCIIVVAMLNNTILECAFIIIAFWATKRAFGKAFHLSSMFKCFVISNLTYYVLNKVTVSIGISIFIPIMLGVGLSYVTSKFVKDVYKPLYKGMPFDVFEETILKVTDKDSVKYKVCYESYIENETDVALSRKYHYSVSGIQKIKSRINDKIRGLN